MPVITAHDAPMFDPPGATITGLASPSRGSSDAAAWRVRLQPDCASPPHSLTREEIFIVLDGAAPPASMPSGDTPPSHAPSRRSTGLDNGPSFIETNCMTISV